MYARSRLQVLENTVGEHKYSPSIATLYREGAGPRFCVAYHARIPNTGQEETRFTEINVNVESRFCVNEVRVVVAEAGQFEPQFPPATASRYSGGELNSSQLAAASEERNGTRWDIKSVQVDLHFVFSVGAQYCASTANSTVEAGLIKARGTQKDNAVLYLNATRWPRNQFGYFLVGHGGVGTASIPGSAGSLCISGGLIGRYNKANEIGYTSTPGCLILQINPQALRTPNGSATAVIGQ